MRKSRKRRDRKHRKQNEEENLEIQPQISKEINARQIELSGKTEIRSAGMAEMPAVVSVRNTVNVDF